MVIGFVLFVLLNGLVMIFRAVDDPLFPYVLLPVVVFTVIFSILSFVLLREGNANAKHVHDALHPGPATAP